MLHSALIKLLLENGANPSSTDVEGNTPLHIIYKHESKDLAKKVECIDVLLENANADIEQRNDEGFTVLGLAIYCENSPSLEQKLIEKGAILVSEIQNPFILSVIKKRVDLLEKMIEKGTEPADDAIGGS